MRRRVHASRVRQSCQRAALAQWLVRSSSVDGQPAALAGSTSLSTAEKPIPVPTDEDRPYWDGAREHKLVLQRCTGCGLYSAQPRVVCPQCHGEAFEWSQVSGKGRIHSYTIVHATTVPGFRDEVPYVVVFVQIDEEPTCYI